MVCGTFQSHVATDEDGVARGAPAGREEGWEGEREREREGGGEYMYIHAVCYVLMYMYSIQIN